MGDSPIRITERSNCRDDDGDVQMKEYSFAKTNQSSSVMLLSEESRSNSPECKSRKFDIKMTDDDFFFS